MTPWVRIDRRIVQAATSISQSGAIPACCNDSKAIRVNTTDAKPLGPNQPMKATDDGRSPVPTKATATGTMRTKVRLSTAYMADLRVDVLGDERANKDRAKQRPDEKGQKQPCVLGEGRCLGELTAGGGSEKYAGDKSSHEAVATSRH